MALTATCAIASTASATESADAMRPLAHVGSRLNALPTLLLLLFRIKKLNQLITKRLLLLAPAAAKAD